MILLNGRLFHKKVYLRSLKKFFLVQYPCQNQILILNILNLLLQLILPERDDFFDLWQN